MVPAGVGKVAIVKGLGICVAFPNGPINLRIYARDGGKGQVWRQTKRFQQPTRHRSSESLLL